MKVLVGVMLINLMSHVRDYRPVATDTQSLRVSWSGTLAMNYFCHLCFLLQVFSFSCCLNISGITPHATPPIDL